jgi:cysteinyl-tRNA synthetase
MNSAEATALLETINKIDSVLGVLETADTEVPENIRELAEKRKTAKLNKNWKEADAVRAEILAHGWMVEDTPGGGYRVKRAEQTI